MCVLFSPLFVCVGFECVCVLFVIECAMLGVFVLFVCVCVYVPCSCLICFVCVFLCDVVWFVFLCAL